MVKNNGPGAVTDVIVNDLLPDGYTYVSHTTIHGSYTPTTGVWDVAPAGLVGPDVPSGVTRYLYITATVNATGNHTNTATLEPIPNDNTPNNNTSSAGVTVTCTNPTISSISPATQTVAQNGTPTNLSVTATGATSYQWYSNTTNSNSGGTLIPGATNTTYTPPTNTIGTLYYYVVVSNVCGDLTSSTTIVTVENAVCNAGNTAPVIN